MTAEHATLEARPRLAALEWKLLGDLLETRFGLAFDDNRRDILCSRLLPRLEELHLDSFMEYYHFLRCHPARESEFVEIAKLATNGESYFFRESHHYDILTRHVAPVCEENGRPLRILSAGCSSGQEAYTAAITLHNLKTVRHALEFEIEGCDINPLRIEWARTASYTDRALWNCDDLTRRACFEQDGSRWRLRPSYREHVSFFEANLATETGENWAPYDVVFCRNVLIYFSSRAFESAIRLFHRCLAPGGYLFLGHSESLINRSLGFEPICLDSKIVYRREDP